MKPNRSRQRSKKRRAKAPGERRRYARGVESRIHSSIPSRALERIAAAQPFAWRCLGKDGRSSQKDQRSCDVAGHGPTMSTRSSIRRPRRSGVASTIWVGRSAWDGSSWTREHTGTVFSLTKGRRAESQQDGLTAGQSLRERAGVSCEGNRRRNSHLRTITSSRLFTSGASSSHLVFDEPFDPVQDEVESERELRAVVVA